MICKVLALAVLIATSLAATSASTPNDSLSDLDAFAEGGVFEDRARSSAVSEKDGCYCEGGCYRETDLLFRNRCCRDICDAMDIKGTSSACKKYCPCYHVEMRLMTVTQQLMTVEQRRPKASEGAVSKGDVCGRKLEQCQQLADNSTLLMEQLKKELESAHADLEVKLWLQIGLLSTYVLSIIGCCCLFKWRTGAACTKSQTRAHATGNNCPTGLATDVITSPEKPKNLLNDSLNNSNVGNSLLENWLHANSSNYQRKSDPNVSVSSHTSSTCMQVPRSKQQGEGCSSPLPILRSPILHCLNVLNAPVNADVHCHISNTRSSHSGDPNQASAVVHDPIPNKGSNYSGDNSIRPPCPASGSSY